MAHVVCYEDIKTGVEYWLETIRPKERLMQVVVHEKSNKQKYDKEHGGCDLRLNERDEYRNEYLWKREYNYNLTWRLWDGKPSDSEINEQRWRRKLV